MTKHAHVSRFHEIDPTQVAIVGGKCAHVAALRRIEGIDVPDGFCVTTHAFERIAAEAAALHDHVERLSRLEPGDREAIRTLSADIRRVIEAIPVPDDLAAAITCALVELGEHAAFAVRSSATAEDLPRASFAGQQDTFLNVVGPAAILHHVSQCWASLFTERAVTYRLRSGFDHRKVRMAVVVQQMIVPRAAGILFTADPVTGNRTVASVDASFGLGEALVSGLVNADVYKVRNGEVVAKTISTKLLAVEPKAGGGTEHRAIAPEQQTKPALTDAQVVRLVELGRRIEAHFGCPQDIEWCAGRAGRADGDGDGGEDHFQFVQSRPITTLFPIPARDDGENHVYVSVGHQQMMTDPLKPLGISVRQLTAGPVMHEAGGRLFVDVTPHLASPASRMRLLLLAQSDPLIGDALQTVVERGEFIRSLPDAGPGGAASARSTSRDRAGANVLRRSRPSFSRTSGASRRARAHGASSKGDSRPRRRNVSSWSASASCQKENRRRQTPNR